MFQSKKDLFVNDNRLNKGDIVHLVNNDIVKIGEKNIYELLIKVRVIYNFPPLLILTP